MSKTAASKHEITADIASVWLTFSILMGIAAGALTAALVYLSPAIAIAWIIVKAVRAL